MDKRKRQAYVREIRSFFIRLILMAAILFVIFGVVFGIAVMPDNDMAPGISFGDLLWYYRLEKDFHSGDVVVFQKEGIRYTGRVVARSGDSVEITEDSRLKVNGSVVYETNIFYSTPAYDTDVEYPVVLKEQEYFVLCDYREGGKDSRYFGAVNAAEIRGIVLAVVRRSNL